MTDVFGSILLTVVIGIVVGVVLPMIFHLVLRELEMYQLRRTKRTCTILMQTIEVMSKHWVELWDNAKKVVEKEKSTDEFFDDLKKWDDEEAHKVEI